MREHATLVLKSATLRMSLSSSSVGSLITEPNELILERYFDLLLNLDPVEAEPALQRFNVVRYLAYASTLALKDAYYVGDEVYRIPRP
ncbi:MAG: hypothetical protein RMI42_01305 [Nitrososphaerota archaeon]|nr:hypothetical protein [Nitrososphaerota archaeon]